MNIKKTIAAAAAAAQILCILPAAVNAQETSEIISSDKNTAWTTHRDCGSEQAYTYLTNGNLHLTSGLEVKAQEGKYNDLNAKKYGEKPYKFKLKTDGTLTTQNDENGTEYDWGYDDAWTPQLGFRYTVNEAANSGKPLIISYDYQVVNSKWDGNPNAHYWQSTYFKVLDFEMYPNTKDDSQKSNKYVIQYNNGTAKSYLALDQSNEADGWHNVKFEISPTVKDGRFQMTAIELDGVVTKLENVYSTTDGKTDADVKVGNIEARTNNQDNRTMSYKNLVISRGIDEVTASASVEDGSIGVEPSQIIVNFSDDVTLSDGAIKLYKDDTEVSGYTVAMSDAKTAVVSFPAYKSRTEYKLVVNASLVNTGVGKTMTDNLTVNFITEKSEENLNGSDNLYNGTASNETGWGRPFTSMESDDNGDLTITVDNDAWKAAIDKGGKYIDSDGNEHTLPNYSAGEGWNFARIKLGSLNETENNKQPIAVEFDVEISDTASCDNAYFYTEMNSIIVQGHFFGGKQLGYFDTGLNRQKYQDGVTSTTRHVKQMIYPVFDQIGTDNKTRAKVKVSVDEYETECVSFDGAPKKSDENMYIKDNPFSIKFTKPASGKAVMKIKNIKIVRTKPLQAAIANTVVSGNRLTINFSDSISAISADKIKIYKDGNLVDGAVTSCTLENDNKRAYIDLNLSETARYNVDISALESVYETNPSGDYAVLGFEYYAGEALKATIENVSKIETDGNTSVSFSISNYSDDNFVPVVIAAAYSSDNTLIGVGTKSVTAKANVDTDDSIVLTGVTGADHIQVMAWNSLTEMTPYCLAKEIN